MVLADADRAQLAVAGLGRLGLPARRGSATRTGPPLRSSGTGSSCSAVVVDAAARAREVVASSRTSLQVSFPPTSIPVDSGAGQPRAAVAVGQQRAGDVRDDQPAGAVVAPRAEAGDAVELDPLASRRGGLGRRRRRRDDALDVDAEQVGRALLERGLDRLLERRLRRAQPLHEPCEPQPRDAVLDPEQLDVAAVGLHVRPHARRAPRARASSSGTG